MRQRSCVFLVCWRFIDWRYSEEDDRRGLSGQMPTSPRIHVRHAQCSLIHTLFSLSLARSHIQFLMCTRIYSVLIFFNGFLFAWISRSCSFAFLCCVFIVCVSSGQWQWRLFVCFSMLLFYSLFVLWCDLVSSSLRVFLESIYCIAGLISWQIKTDILFLLSSKICTRSEHLGRSKQTE